jgi:hypothetical protein
VRLFVAETAQGDWDELTDGGGQTVRVAAADLQQAQRARARIRAEHPENPEGVAVILDVTVAVAADYRSASSRLHAVAGTPATVHYAGTVAGLTGLIADIESADVADGVTLIPAIPIAGGDLHGLGADVLRLLAQRNEPKAS